jgi:hypothetical protein
VIGRESDLQPWNAPRLGINGQIGRAVERFVQTKPRRIAIVPGTSRFRHVVEIQVPDGILPLTLTPTACSGRNPPWSSKVNIFGRLMAVCSQAPRR